MSMFKEFMAYVVIGAATITVGTMDATDAQAEHEHYCGMVELYKQTDGKHGWPAYKSEVDCAE